MIFWCRMDESESNEVDNLYGLYSAADSPGLETQASPPDLEGIGISNSWPDNDDHVPMASASDLTDSLVATSTPPTAGITEPFAVPFESPIQADDDESYRAPFRFLSPRIDDSGDAFKPSFDLPSPPRPTYGPEFPPDLLGDTKVCDGTPGLCGFHNLGNTCFMSAGLQCLLETPCLVQYFLSRQPYWSFASEKNEFGACSLLEEFTVLIYKVWSGRFKILHPAKFKEVVAELHPQFKDYRQHDCQEFLTLLLDSLHEQLNQIGEMDARGKSLPQPENSDLASKTSYCESSRSSQCSSPRSSESLNSEVPISSRLQAIPDSLRCIVEEPMVAASQVSDEMNAVSKGPNSIVHEKTPSPLNCDRENSQTLELNNQSDVINPRINRLEDILKDAKTPNINVLAKDEDDMNNQLKFDSEKFTKPENSRPPNSIYNANLAECYNFDNKTAITKKIKDTNLLQDRIKCRLSDEPVVNSAKRRKVNEKNMQLEFQRRMAEVESAEESLGTDEADMGASEEGAPVSPTSLQDEMEADQQWDKYVTLNNSIVVDSFQGQFKSTVVCTVCGNVSVTFEPFMYLSVPLPKAMERQIVVTVVGSRDPTQYLLKLNKHDNALRLKECLRRIADIPSSSDIVLAEVLDNHIAKTVDDGMMLRFVNDVNRSIYAFEMNKPPADEDGKQKDSEGAEKTANTGEELLIGAFGPECNNSEWKTCTICLEELADNLLLIHPSCSCALCSNCIEMSMRHQSNSDGGDNLICPVCNLVTNPQDDFIPLTSMHNQKPRTRLLDVPIVFRLDTLPEGDNSKRSYQLFQHPAMLRLPSHISTSTLYEEVHTATGFHSDYKLRLVDGQGYRCSRCMFTAHCRGCEVPNGVVDLQPGDNLAVVFSNVAPVVSSEVVQHSSMEERRGREPLTVHDCIRAFSESETLDSGNPWYCPRCEQNQCATKTLGVWRFPSIVMIYLKRFVFYEGSSLKVEDKVIFPLSNLDLSPYLVGPQSLLPNQFDLYAVVCHFGGTSAGHYTAYSRHPVSGEWHYFNDDNLVKNLPQEEDYSNAYILFYQRVGSQSVLAVPENVMLPEDRPVQDYKPDIDVILNVLDASMSEDQTNEGLLNC